MYVNLLPVVYNIPINYWLNMEKEMHYDSQKQIFSWLSGIIFAYLWQLNLRCLLVLVFL